MKDKIIDLLCKTYNEVLNIDYQDCMIDETIDEKIKRITFYHSIVIINFTKSLKQTLPLSFLYVSNFILI